MTPNQSQLRRPAASYKIELLRVLVLLLGLLICILGTWLVWPGYTVDGRSYSYPVTGSLLAVLAVGWVFVLAVTFFALKAMKNKRL